jgi:hypothetical protein
MRQATSENTGQAGVAPLSPRAGILALLASPVGGEGALRAAIASIPEAQIPLLLERIAWHRIDGLAHRAVRRLAPADLHPWLRFSLKRRHQRVAAATLVQGLALAEVLEVLDRNGIPAIVMRGIRHAEWIYGDPGARPFEDHDLLVQPGDRAPVAAALRRLGFEPSAPALFRRGGVLIDLHTEPLGAGRRPTRRELFPIAVTRLFRRAATGRVAGAPALILESADEILLLAVHLVKHSFDRLVRIADLAHAVAVHGGTIDWPLLHERAVAVRLERVLARAFEAAAMLGVVIPDPFRGAPAGRLERALMDRVGRLVPMPWTGEMLMARSAGDMLSGFRFLMDALLPAGEVPAGPLARAAALPRRAVAVTHGAVRWIADRSGR